MGLVFSLNNANLVAHLIDGKVTRFLDEAPLNSEVFAANQAFVDTFVNVEPVEYDADPVLITTPAYWRRVQPEFVWLREKWPQMQAYWREHGPDWRANLFHQQELINFFTVLSQILARCEVKALLVPDFSDSELSRTLRSRDLIERLVEIHPGSSALILQVNEQLTQDDKTSFNVFDKFNSAYEKIEQWPGVLVWNKRRSSFVPVRSEEDVIRIFTKLRDNKAGFFRERTAGIGIKKYVYLFHISDLHFGFSETTNRVRRLKAIMKNRLDGLDDCLAAIPVITGDIQNSPQRESTESFGDFCDTLRAFGFEDPVVVPGNHDERLIGLSSTLARRAETFGVSARPIESFPEFNLRFLRFDSNMGGLAASGRIGEQQLIDMGGRLEGTDSTGQFDIALLHHHPIGIDDPDWYKQEFYERILTPQGRVLTQRLNDAERFLEWLRKRGIGFVLHGHKHIPMIQADGTGSIQVIGAGSSTGNVSHQDWRKTYLSYNLLKFDPEFPKVVSCTIVAEEVIGGGTRDIQIELY